MAKLEDKSDVSLKIELRQRGGIRLCWRSWNFANPGNFAKLADIRKET